MSDTTSLDDLPVRGVGGPPVLDANANANADADARASVAANGRCIAPATREEAVSEGAAPNNVRLDIDVDPTVMNKVVTDIRARTDRQAGGGGGGGGGGATLPLPERNIPSEPHMQSLLHDSASSPNYVPPASPSPSSARGGAGTGHVGESAKSVLDRLRRGSKRDASVDAMFDDFKGLVFIAVVYYAFQTPYAHTLLKRLFAFGYNEDGTTNQIGIFVGCVTFSVVVFSLNHVQMRVAELLR